MQLTYLEFELLRTLAASPGRVYSRQALLEALWGGSEYRDPRTIDVHVRHLREKIEPRSERAPLPLHGARRRLPVPRGDMNQFRHPRLSVKLGLVLLAIVAGALGIVYAAVVPRLENRLVANRIDELERSTPPVVEQFRRANQFDYDTLARFFQASLGARVVVFEPLGQDTVHTVGDSNPVALRT